MVASIAGLWPKVRRIWATLGTAFFVIFTGWSLWAYRARPEAWSALQSDARVTVARGGAHWFFQPAAPRDGGDVGLLFFPGALVDPAAYAPLTHSIAEAGYPVVLVEVPRRAAFGGADGPAVMIRARDAMGQHPGVRRWVIAGHSRGGALAARFIHERIAPAAGLVMIGTSHPRDFSLAESTVPVTRVFGTRDTVADVEKLEATRHNLPPSTRMVRIDGANHSQFAHYGFQPGDWPAAIDRQTQQAATRRAILDMLDGVRLHLPPAR